MTKRWTWLALLLLAMVALWGCSDDDDPAQPTQTAFDKMADAVIEYINDSADCPGVILASQLAADLDNYKVFDIRSASTYLAGHIPGAINAPSGANSLKDCVDVITANATTSDNIVVTCYSGQSAGHVKVALELLGYENVKSLMWGMCGWSSQTSGSWDNNTGNALASPETANNNGELTTHALPTLSESVDTVVADRVNAMLTAGFKSITYANLVGNGPDNYFIVNYFGQADYEGTGTAGVPGHIPGAYQFTPYASMGVDQMLANLPTDMPIVVYCWT
ncbi:rhodanese-like domain-containing protein, partial [bacterium]|nr:rhodanese-like domain-containing protein [bacterium]